MDKRKLEVLHTVGYRIPETCGLCRHARPFGEGDWSTCRLTTYEHTKHTRRREMSINRLGVCNLFEGPAHDAYEVSKLEGFADFIEFDFAP